MTIIPIIFIGIITFVYLLVGVLVFQVLIRDEFRWEASKFTALVCAVWPITLPIVILYLVIKAFWKLPLK